MTIQVQTIDAIGMQEFAIDKKYLNLMKVCFVVFLAFTALGIALLFIPRESDVAGWATLTISMACVLLFGGFAVMSWRSSKKPPYMDVCCDEDGIWYKHRSKESGLVPWQNVVALRERRHIQCIDIVDAQGERQLRVEYQLKDFERLRELLVARSANNGQGRHAGDFAKGLMHHLNCAASLIGVFALSLVAGFAEGWQLGVLVTSLILLIFWEYVTAAYRVVIHRHAVTVLYPFREKNLRFSDIKSIDMADTFYKGRRLPEVRVVLRDGRAHALRQIGVDANVLYSALTAAKKRFHGGKVKYT